MNQNESLQRKTARRESSSTGQSQQRKTHTTSKQQPQQHRQGQPSTTHHGGVDLKRLKGWASHEFHRQLFQEEAQQEIALMKMKSIVISNAMIVRLQSWWRMYKCRIKYLKYKRERYFFLHTFFRAWFTTIRAEISFRVSSSILVLTRPFTPTLSNSLSSLTSSISLLSLTPSDIVSMY